MLPLFRKALFLLAFLLPVMAFAQGPYPMQTYILSWNAPTTNTDGSPLTDLAGYRFYYSNTPGGYAGAPGGIQLGNVLRHEVSFPIGPPGVIWYFAISAYNSKYVVGPFSKEVNTGALDPIDPVEPAKNIVISWVLLPPEVVKYPLSVYIGGLGGVSFEPASVDYKYEPGQTVRLTATTPYPGYRFVGWTGDVVSSNPVIDVVMDKDKVLTATFSNQ